MSLILLALLCNQILICDAKIGIYVKTASERDGVLTDFKGADKKTITNMEVQLFNITDYNLNRGVKIELGKVPDDIFLKDPTRYGDLYEKYKWTPVTRELQVKKVEIVDVIKESVVLKTHKHINNTTKTIKTNVSMYETVQNRVTSLWSKEGLPVDDIVYEIYYNFTGGGKLYSNRWRHVNFHGTSLPFGVLRNGYVNIKQGQSVIRRLKAKETIILIKIQYSASLSGNVVLNYAHVYGKYHFWAPNVKDIMSAVGLVDEIVTTELIEVRCYTDPVLEITDGTSGDAVPVQMPRSPLRIRFKHRQTVKLKKH